MGCKILEGIRVADFSWAWAGPRTAEQLAFLGAEVIKIESALRPDLFRWLIWSGPKDPRLPMHSHISAFTEVNRGKLDCTLNFRNPKAIDLAKRLIGKSDIVIENFAPGVMDRLGLGYEELKKIKPDIIMLSQSACGQTGPESAYAGYDPCFPCHGGLAYLTGYRDGDPLIEGGTSDLRNGQAGVVAVLIALYYHKRTGKGQWIDQSNRDTMTMLIGDMLLDYIMNGRIPERMENLDPYWAPHNVYRCQGGDRPFVSIAIATDEEWKAFCNVIGHPEWLEDKRFADNLSRWRNRDELDKLIEGWTINHSKFQVMNLLQRVGVAATVCYDPLTPDLFCDVNVRDRQSFIQVNHTELGPRWTAAPVWRFSETPASIDRHAPLVGEHNDYVFGQLLGLSQEEIQKLKEEQAIA